MVDLAGPAAPGSTAGLDQLISRRLHKPVMLTVRFTEQRILGTDTSPGTSTIGDTGP